MSDPDGAPDPFQGMPPIFGDLARMFAQQGSMGWEAARQLALGVATGGTAEANVDPIDRIALEQLARVAELRVGEATGLATSQTGRGLQLLAATRSQWVQRTLDDWRPYFDLLSTSLDQGDDEYEEPDAADPFGWMAPLMKMVGPMLLGLTAGSMVGHLGQRSFGFYDLPLPRPATDEVLILLGNLDEFGRQWSLPTDDLRLWVCVHETTHHAVLGVPHVGARLDSLLRQYLAAFETDDAGLESRVAGLDPADPSGFQAMLGDPEVLLGMIQSPAQQAMLPQLQALVCAIVGYVDHIMDRVGTGLIAAYPMVTEAVRRRRVQADQSSRFAERLFGLELTQSAVDRGAAFVEGVVERAGTEGLDRLWRRERDLPTPAEVDAPGLWLARIDLPE
jgi:putative hydrolase